MANRDGRYVISINMLLEKTIWLLTVCLIAFFCIGDTSQYGSFFLMGITLLLLLCMLMKWNGRLKIHLGMLHWLTMAFAVYCFISGFWAVDSGAAFSKAVTIVEILICVSVPYWFYYDMGETTPLLKAIMWGGYAVCIYTFLRHGIDGVFTALIRSTILRTEFANINSVGMTAAMSVIIGTHFWQQEGFKLSSLMLIPSVIVVAASCSRKAMVLMIAGVFLLLLLKSISDDKLKSVFRVCFIIFMGVLCIYGMTRIPIFSGAMKRMSGLLASLTGIGKVDGSTQLRNEFAAFGWRLFLQHPLFGVGVDNASFYNLHELGYNVYLHNNFVELLASGGIIGFSLFYSLYLYPLARILRSGFMKSGESQLLVVMLVLLLAMDYGVVSYYSKDTHMFLMTFFLYISVQDKGGVSSIEAKKSI